MNTNYAPSDSEVAQIRKLLEDQIVEITQIDQEISRLGDGMLQKCDKIKGYISGLETLLSPTRRIPVEILQKVFSFCLPTGRNPLMSAKEAPLLLGAVCRHWREVSISTPTLWAAIHIPVVYCRHPPIPLAESQQISLRLNDTVKRWLDRSGTCPLSISVAEIRVGHGDNPDVENDPGQSLLEILAQCSRRWRKIAFTGTSLLPRLTALTEEDIPLLESFSIKVSSTSSRARDASGSTIFHAPRLHTLRLIDMSGKILDYQICWLNLTELCIERHGVSGDVAPTIQPAVALALLSKCQNLVRCRLDIVHLDSATMQQESEELVVLPSLIELQITEIGASIVGFYKHLDTPALKKFNLSSMHMPPGDLPASALLSRSPLLETLTIGIETLTYQHVAHCLLNTPSITTLILKPATVNQFFIPFGPDGSVHRTEPVVSDRLLTFLTPSPDAGKAFPCPFLQDFQFRHSNAITDEVKDEVLLKLIKSRTKRVEDGSLGQLRSVSGDFRRCWTVDLTKHLSSEIADGLKLNLRYRTMAEETMSPATGVRWDEMKHDLRHHRRSC